MHLTPKEIDRLLLYQAAELARRRRGRGLKLNYPEACALIADEICEGARDGRSVAELMEIGATILTTDDVLPGVDVLMGTLQVEAFFDDGQKLVTVHAPVRPGREAVAGVEPGEIVTAEGEIELSAGREVASVTVANVGDRPVQVGSHFHFFEVNRALRFDRARAFGMHLDIAAGTAVRFEPGDEREVDLVAFGGTREVHGLNRLTEGPAFGDALPAALARAEQAGFLTARGAVMGRVLSRRAYAELFGPTTGDRIRLGDTDLWAEVERDLLVPGDESVFGGGKTLRDGMGTSGSVTAADGALDFVITNVVLIDAVLGIVKADIGIKDGRIAGVGKAGNPQIMDGVTPGMTIGANTDVRSAEGMIATAGAIDVHVHFDSAGLCEEAISSGVTTMIGGGLGPVTVGITSSGTVNLARMLQAAEAFPLNFGFLGKGSAHAVEPLLEQGAAGCIGLKIHEDWGATPAVIQSSLDAGDELDIQVQIHTDTLNESGFYEDSIAAIDGRTIHAYHSEGAGGGHAPDIIRVAGEANVLPSSTNPTNPYTVNTFDEHLDMVMVCHHLNPRVPEDVAFAESRIRRETIAAEDVLHDLGAISAMGSDSQGMGRIGETITRTWQVAAHMKAERGSLPGDVGTSNDNARIKRYVAKLTINPALIYGISHEIGSLEQGKLADIVLWEPRFFGIKPEVVFKGGFPAWSVMGESNASLMTCQPLSYRPQWGAYGPAVQATSVTFMAGAAIEAGIPDRLGLQKRCVATHGTRSLAKRDMVWNDAVPEITVDPETYRVEVDGVLATCEPWQRVPLGRLYVLK